MPTDKIEIETDRILHWERSSDLYLNLEEYINDLVDRIEELENKIQQLDHRTVGSIRLGGSR